MHGLKLLTLGVDVWDTTLPAYTFPEQVVPERSHQWKSTRTLRLRWPIFTQTVNEPIEHVDLHALEEGDGNRPRS